MTFRALNVDSTGYRLLTIALVALTGAGLYAAFQMEHHGHAITGMSNQIVWGVPHVFAIFLILAASGALNVASVGTVFQQGAYKPLARLSGLLAAALLLGGLVILVLDLGRPDRLLVAMTHYNFRSIFAWNIFLYTGFLGLIAVYLWTLMERRMEVHSRAAGVAAFLWRLVLTTGTGSIFGFLVAREAYDTAVLAPIFVAESLACGLAVFLLVTLYLDNRKAGLLDDALLRRLKNLLAIFVALVLYLIATFHLTNLYAAEHTSFERYILLDHPVHSVVFWAGKIAIGGALPLIVCWSPGRSANRRRVVTAAAGTVLGTLCFLYVTIIGGQSYPLNIFPGFEVVDSGFLDHTAAGYVPSIQELGLGLGGVALSLVVVIAGLRILPFLPARP